MIQRVTDRGIEIYAVRLTRVVENNVVLDNKFQWLIAAERIDGWEIRNRPWQAVGPTFATSKKGASWLGFQDSGAPVAEWKENREAVIDEYNAMFSDEPEGIKPQTVGHEHKTFARMGRPSQGRTARVQSAVTPELMQQIAAEKQASETMSDVVFRLLEKAVSK